MDIVERSILYRSEVTFIEEAVNRKPAVKVKVLFYSGYKGQETPRLIIVDDEEIAVEEILSRKRIFHARSGTVLEAFSCKTRRGIVKLQELANGGWLARFL